MQYLYGASVQGIQDFIFASGKLKEIAGASEIVEQLCGNAFDQFLEQDLNVNLPDDVFITRAAGNIRLFSADQLAIQAIVRAWPQKVDSLAPGTTLSQAVVECEGERLTKTHIDALEKKLRTQRNKLPIPADLGGMSVIRSRRTGKPALMWEGKKAPMCRGAVTKSRMGGEEAAITLLKKSLPENLPAEARRFPFNVEDITAGRESTWLAVVHADGNNLGKIIQGISQKLEKDGGSIQDAFRNFSTALDLSTTNAAKQAVDMLGLKGGKSKYPFRPVIIGGDDLTMIIRADLALKFTETFLLEFERETRKNMAELVGQYRLVSFKNGLSACAGIAYMKTSYPFHYAVYLAETLCADAKKASKDINHENVPASIAFHKIQDSFVEDYRSIVNRELQPNPELSFKFGPYGLDPNGSLPSLQTLKEQVELVNQPDAPKSGLRKWLGLLHDDPNEAAFWLERVREIAASGYCEKLGLDDAVKSNKSHLYDVLALASLSEK